MCVTEPYSPRSAQAHLSRVQEMLRAAGPQDDMSEGRSPSVLHTLTQTAGKKEALFIYNNTFCLSFFITGACFQFIIDLCSHLMALNVCLCVLEAPPTPHSSKNRRANSKSEQSAEAPSPPVYIQPGASDLPPLTTLMPNNAHSDVCKKIKTLFKLTDLISSLQYES